ncbi:MAG: glycosyltransferase [Candidatus Thermoplasmatota archaeon]|nr:glycosyltransferase [Candidatus Thermoplasmatota archaeon]
MKVLLINKFYFLKGGAEKHFFDVKDLLEKNGHEVVVFSMKHEKNETSPYEKYFVSNVDFKNVRFDKNGLRTAGRMFYSFEAERKISQLIKKEKPDIAHVHNIYHQISPSVLLALKKHSIPIVLTMHDYKILCPNYLFFTKGKICERCRGYNYWQAIKYRCLKNSMPASTLACIEMYFHKIFKIYEDSVNVFISPSQFLIKKIREWDVPIIEIRHLPNFVNLEEAEYVKPGNYFLYFGRLSREKGLKTLVEAAKGQSFKLKIAGIGPMENELKKKVSEENINNIEFLGYKSGNDLKEIIKNSLAVVVPSEWYENQPLTILEASVFGKPAIGSNVGGIPEMINDGKSGYLFETGSIKDLREKMNRLNTDYKLVADMGQEAFKFAQSRSSEEYYKKLNKIYASLLVQKK